MISNHNVYIITKKINELTSENLPVRLKQGNKASKNDIADFVKQTDFGNKPKSINKKVTSNKTKQVAVEKKLSVLSNEIKLLSTKGCNFFLGRLYFTGDDCLQNTIAYQPRSYCYKKTRTLIMLLVENKKGYVVLLLLHNILIFCIT